MKLKFKRQGYQTDAVEAVAGLLCQATYDLAQELADAYVVMERGVVIAQDLGRDMETNGVRKLVAI